MKRPRLETVNEFRDAFLEGRSADFIAKFNERDLNHQYVNIMSWIRRNNAKAKAETPVVEKKEVVGGGQKYLSQLRKMRRNLEKGLVLTDLEIRKVGKELNYMREALTNYTKIQRELKIKALEQESQKIADQIAALMAE